MKLSEAIRLGAMMGPQAVGQMFRYDGATCAQGAAFLAIGLNPNKEYPQTLYRIWPDLKGTGKQCPACSDKRTGIFGSFSMIAHLNDSHRWTRERIADWVESIELEQELAESQKSAEQEKVMVLA